MRSVRKRLPVRRLKTDSDGVTIVEFAIVAPVLLMMLFGIFDIGHAAYVRSVLQGAVQDAGRNAGLESGQSQLNAIDQYVQNQLASLVPNGEFDVERFNYLNYVDIGRPEDFDDKNGNNVFDEDEECFTDANENGQWDADMGSEGLGGANDVVFYRVTVTYDRVFPLWRFIGLSEQTSLSATTVLRNQPYSRQRKPREICPPPAP